MNFIKDIYIDISGKPDAGAIIYSKEGDGGLYYVRVHIMDGDTVLVLDPTAVYVALSAKKPDRTVVLDDSKTSPDNICINEDGTVTVLLTPTLQSVSGLERIELIILDSDNNQITTATFTNCIVPRAVDPGGMVNSDEYLFLKRLISEAETAVGTVNAAAESIAAAETARSFFDTYNPETVYVKGNKVTYAGSSYLAILTSSGIAPPEPYHWLLIAAKGDRGEDGDKTFVHVQYEASEVWHINHNLNKYPAVTVIDSAGSVVVGDIEYNDINNVTVSFIGGFSGRAICN